MKPICRKLGVFPTNFTAAACLTAQVWLKASGLATILRTPQGASEKEKQETSKKDLEVRWVFPKIGEPHPKMDGENNGKPY